MQGFFTPAINLMNRLKYPGKFAVTGALACVSIAILLTTLALNLTEAIRQTRHELAVIELMAPLHKLIQLTQQHRGISAAWLSGDAALQKKLEDKRDEVDAAVKLADVVVARHATLFGGVEEWQAIKSDWAHLRADVTGMAVAQTLAMHGRLIQLTLHYQEDVADIGGLMVDREVDTHHLAETLVRSLPQLLERLGTMRAKGTGILVRKELNDADRVAFSVQRILLQNTLDELSFGLEKAGRYSPSLAARLEVFSKELSQATALAVALLDKDVIGAQFAVTPEAFFDKFTLAIDIGYRELFDTLLPTLGHRLDERIATLRVTLLLEFGLAIVSILLLTYVSLGAYYSIIESVRRLSVGAASVAGGDLAARIQLEGRDELAAVGESFNAMAIVLGEQWLNLKETMESLAEALAAAKLADQTKDEFLANMSHELRTPLNAVIGMAGLARGLGTDPRQRDYLDKIISSGKHLNRIINDLLDLSKIAAGHMEFESIDFSVRSLIAECNSAMAHRASEKGLELVETIDPAVPDVLSGDPLRVEQILLNLVGNAIKFTLTGRVEIRVSVHAREEGRVCLDFDVEDTGVGMRPEDIDRLFKPFSQADATVSRKFGGTGLGLAISKRLAEMMDGEISVISREGSGSTFRVRLWFAQGDVSVLPASEAEDEDALPGRYANATVVVAEDQPLNREIVEALLLAVGIVPRMVENGLEALHLLDESGPAAFDLVLMDVQMPVMDGLTATRELRSRSGFEKLPIIAMTAHTMAHEKEIAVDAGVNDHIGKPFDNASFYRTLARWIPKEKQIAALAAEALTASAQPHAAAGGARSPLRGIDFAAGLSRFNGKQDRYRHWLTDFVATAAQLPEQVRGDLAAGQPDKAAKLAHAFKGRVGMLGMVDLHAVVSALELALRDGSPADGLLSSVERMIGQTCDELAKVLIAGKDSELAGEQDFEKVVWRDAYSIGVADLDRQHQGLIALINQLVDCREAQSAGSSAVFHEILSGLFDYAQVHFKAEEAHLHRIGYPHIAAHELEHAVFVETVTSFSLAAVGGVLDLAGVHRYLREWLLGHILESDMQYRRFTEKSDLAL